MIAEAEQPQTVARASHSARPAPADMPRRIEELGRIILAYSEVTDRLQKSHEQLTQTVDSLRHELSEKNRLLERKNRLAALGEMAAGLAHEIRNPLGGIQLYASMLARDVADRQEPLRTVQKISAGVKRLEALVGQVLQFTREIVAQPQPCDLTAVVRQSAEYASKSFEENAIDCRIDGPESLAVTVDPVLIGQVILNLLLNASQAMEGGGKVFVSYGLPPGRTEAKQFHVVVRDTGPGISPQIIDRIFNPFFTTKDSGTGLGLAIVHRIVEAHEGSIVAGNAEGGGAQFEIRV